MPLKALIVGGGIGGLAAAVALRRAGLGVEVYERAEAFGEVGAGLTLWANALRALRGLGLAGAVLAKAQADRPAALRTSSGEILIRMTPEDFKVRDGPAAVAVHRAEVLGILAGAVGEGVIRFGTTFTRFEQDAAGVTAHFADARGQAFHARGDVLIGADGLRSAVRGQLFPAVRPVYAGYTAWRGIAAPGGELPDLLPGESWGRGRRFGIVPLDARRIYWFATLNAPEHSHPGPPGEAARDTLLRHFGRWHAPVRALLESTPAANILRNDIYDFGPMPKWGAGRVTLLGDAAHAMTPNMGQGACQAIEDAAALGKCFLNIGDDPPEALFEYECRRVPRASWFVRESRKIGRVGQWQNRFACWLRNAVVKRGRKQMQKQFAKALGTE